MSPNQKRAKFASQKETQTTVRENRTLYMEREVKKQYVWYDLIFIFKT